MLASRIDGSSGLGELAAPLDGSCTPLVVHARSVPLLALPPVSAGDGGVHYLAVSWVLPSQNVQCVVCFRFQSQDNSGMFF